MIELNSTWNTIVMLLVAFGVGLLGGIGAALLEWKKGQKEAEDGSTPSKLGFLAVVASVVLGGIAAVAVLYFFPPVTEVKNEGGELLERSYDLIKLVAFSLLVGTAGAAILQSMQSRALGQIEAGRAKAEKATAVDTASKGVASMAEAVPNAVKASITAPSSDIEQTLQDAGVQPGQMQGVLDDLAEAASNAVTVELGPHVENTQSLIEAAGAPTPAPAASPDKAVAPGNTKAS
ncbi:MAG TPA: hypothetical protein VFY75_05030 [Solirubrobacterales bacterium]|nr:hypothetical protein [Solirubrobacterales bacterium]